jgi:hypothetical protein
MNDAQTAAPFRSVETLGKMINLPLQPTEAWYEEVPEGTPGGLGPTDYVLVAVMRFEPHKLAKFGQGAAGKRAGEPRVLSLANRPWFPRPVKTALRVIDADTVGVRGEQFSGTAFAKGAYSDGSFVIVEGGEYVLLVLGTS